MNILQASSADDGGAIITSTRMYQFTAETVDLDAIRARIARMTDAELVALWHGCGLDGCAE